MPNRILRGEALRNSETVDGLTDPCFRFYILLLTYHEDFGRFDARPVVLRANLYPFSIDKIRVADISRWIAECEKAGLIVLYEAESKPFGVVLRSSKPRAKGPMAPEPPAGVLCWRAGTSRPVLTTDFINEAGCAHMRAYEITCAQTRPYSGSDSIAHSSLSYSGSESGVPPGEREGNVVPNAEKPREPSHALRLIRETNARKAGGK